MENILTHQPNNTYTDQKGRVYPNDYVEVIWPAKVVIAGLVLDGTDGLRKELTKIPVDAYGIVVFPNNDGTVQVAPYRLTGNLKRPLIL